MRVLSFMTGINIILICCSLMIIVNYFIDLNNICSGSCFFEHFFKDKVRALFFLFIVDCITLLLYIRISFLLKKINQAESGILQSNLSKITQKTLTITSITVLIQLVLLIITTLQQRDEADKLQLQDCTQSIDQGQCQFQSANNSVLTTGKILTIAFISIHSVLSVCGYRFLSSPSTRVEQIPDFRNSQVNNEVQQMQVNAIFVLPQQDQGKNLVQGQNLDEVPQNAIFSFKPAMIHNPQKQQNEIQIGEVVLL